MAGLWETLKAQQAAIEPAQEKPVVVEPNQRLKLTPVEVDVSDLLETRGRKRVYASNAERQKAYRNRQKDPGDLT